MKGLVVTAGFIDLHSHGQTPENYVFKARDGVTSALEMEVGVNPVLEWYNSREGKSLVNFGATSGHIAARMKVMRDTGQFLPRDRVERVEAVAVRVPLAAQGALLGLAIVAIDAIGPEGVAPFIYFQF